MCVNTKPDENEGKKDVYVEAPTTTATAYAMSPEVYAETGLAVVQNTMKEIVTNTSAISKELPKMIQDGLGQVQAMFWIQFGFGIFLFIVAIGLGAAGFNQVLAVIVGTTGGVTLITTLVTTPPMRLQNNRVALSQWLIAYQNWYNALSVISAFMTEEAKQNKLDFIRFQAYNDYLLRTMNTILDIIQETCKVQESSLATTKTKNKSQ
jgi:hypothetical protein